MNVRCPTCRTVFRVDPEKVPATGIRARCSRCSTAFRIEAPAREPAPAAPTPSVPPAAPARPETPAQPGARPPFAGAPTAAAPPPASPARGGGGSASPAAAAAPAAGPAPATRRPSFRNQDPASRAQRIARALVSDIVAYNKDKLQQSLAAGTLRSDFREEIRKSWEEYVGQVGLDMAKTTPFFRDSLNEILAKGQKMF